MPWLRLLWKVTITTLDPSARSSLVAACMLMPESLTTQPPMQAHWALREGMLYGQPTPPSHTGGMPLIAAAYYSQAASGAWSVGGILSAPAV